MGSVASGLRPAVLFLHPGHDRPDRPCAPADIFHAVPFLLGLLAYGAYSRSPAGGPAWPGIIGWIARHPWLAVTWLSTLQTVVYVASIVRLLRAYSERIKATYSTIDQINLAWLRRRLAIYASIWVVGLATIAVVGFEGRALGLFMQIVAFLTALNIFATGYRALRQSEVVLGLPRPRPGRRYERSSLTPENAALYRTRLLDSMERERSYSGSRAHPTQAGPGPGVPVAHLSRVINEQLGRNFFDFINRYRVEEAKRRLSGPAAGRDKLITVALDCGFNSLATFNRVFKELAGRTPSEYRRIRKRHSRLPSETCLAPALRFPSFLGARSAARSHNRSSSYTLSRISPVFGS